MGDADAAAIRAARGDWLSDHLRPLHLRSARGPHLRRECARGPHADHTLLDQVCRSQVAKVYIRPLIYRNVGREIVIVASKGVADTHQGWY